MFAEFENILNKISIPKNDDSSNNFSKIPQKYTINQRQIQELKLLSEGSFGFIWLAEDIHSKQKYALKRVICQTQEQLKSALTEKQLMSRFAKNPHLVSYQGGNFTKINVQTRNINVVVTLMELCPNGTLFDLLEKKQDKGFSENELLSIMKQILIGLQIIHESGYYHRDIKIQNVLVAQNNQLKLCDFGSCTNQIIDFAQISKKEYDHIKEQIQMFTTPMYRPPEVVDPYLRYKVNHKVDIWMVGCILYTLSFFMHPFANSNSVGIASGIYQLSESKYKVTQKIKDLIRHMLTPNPEYRPEIKNLLQIIEKWNSLASIPLNSEAQNRKRQQLEKERESMHLNRNLIEEQGDIPIQKLMQLQMKLQKQEVQGATTSFITKKQKIINSTVSSIIKTDSKLPSKKTKQKNITSNTIWENKNQSKNNSNSNANFGIFNNIWDAPKQENKSASKNFSDFGLSNNTFGIKSNIEKKSSKKQQFENLLDL